MIQGCYTAGAFVYQLFRILGEESSSTSSGDDDDNSNNNNILLYDAARAAYELVFTGLHTWTVRQAVLLGLRSLPPKAVFMERVAGEIVIASTSKTSNYSISEKEIALAKKCKSVHERFSSAWVPLSKELLKLIGDAPVG